MPSAPDRIREAVTHIQDWLTHTPNPGEAIVRQAIVLRLLHAAGFDIWNPAEVVPEETNATGNRADFLIRSGHGAFALELKGMNVTLGAAHYQQAATYAVNEGTRWAIVTNGRVWAVLDEHLPGRWEDRVALKLELGQEGHTFADDLAALLDVDTWRSGRFPDALHGIRQRQEQRLDEARIRREKTPLVEQVRQQFGIATFDLAAQAAAEMNRITETERDVLLGQAAAPSVTGGIPMTFTALGCTARVLYFPEPGTRGLWRLLAGSRVSTRLREDPGWKNFNARRAAWVQDGTLKQISETQYELIRDCEFTSPSDAACMVCVRPVSGWDVWKDDHGRAAQHYRPAPTP